MDFDALPQLDGDRVSLVPLSLDHLGDLESAVSERDLWKTWYTRIPSADGMRADIERRLALRETRELLPWGIRDNARGVMVGMTTFLNIVPADRRVEIGSTWLSKSSQRTGINTEAKLLQLTYAFEGLD
ncbi:MAG TPA: GNAT family N-acetyltransferase, partial [Microbacteriaceae bacterium]|nr:GNAT family N-acetyltransferase [Microbacteriaceae bacterium]